MGMSGLAVSCQLSALSYRLSAVSGGGGGPGVHAVVEFPEAGLVDVGVDLGRADVGVAEHGLHRPQIRTVVQEVGGKGMAQHMGADGLRPQARGPGVAF